MGNPAPFDYCLWLSLNPENDGTAIWVEKKFDMPGSGAWVSERVFSIPLAAGAASRSPGLVVFECTPLHGVDDEIEKCVLFLSKPKKNREIDVIYCRKYRVLDDCARLREVIETFPEDRHFIPSVLFILWNEDDSETLPDDLRRMVRSIRDYCAGLGSDSQERAGRRLRGEKHHRISRDIFFVIENKKPGREIWASADLDGVGHGWWTGRNHVAAR